MNVCLRNFNFFNGKFESPIHKIAKIKHDGDRLDFNVLKQDLPIDKFGRDEISSRWPIS